MYKYKNIEYEKILEENVVIIYLQIYMTFILLWKVK